MKKLSVTKLGRQRKLLAGDAVSPRLKVGNSSSGDVIVDPMKVGKSWTARQLNPAPSRKRR